MRPIHRTTARVLPVSVDGRVLLIQEQDPAHPGVLRWASIGGGAEAGEGLRQTAVRELWEETGIACEDTLLVGPFHQQLVEYSFDSVDYVADSTYFALLLDDEPEVSFEHLEPDEVGNVLAARWWRPDEMAEASFADPGLPGMMHDAVALVRGDV